MKNLKEIIIGIFAVIGVLALVTGFTNNTENAVQTTTPESHIWELYLAERENADDRVYLLNKATGEVRKYSSKGMTNGKLKDQYYQVMTENKEGEK